jgi:hypothetical protein
MTASNWTDGDSIRAREIWSEYEQHYDLLEKLGQTVGIAPSSGHIWFGDSVQDVIAQRDAEGVVAPLYLVRVGSPTYHRKGGHR